MKPRILLLTAAICLLIPSAAAADFVHVVAPGESLTSIAGADGLSVAQLAAANGLSTDQELVAGATIDIPPQSAGVETAPIAAPVSSAPAVADSSGYLVMPGDTLTAIAARDGVSVAQLAAANGLDPNGILLAGITLTLPAAGSEATASAAVPEAAPTSEAAAPADGVGPPYPTDEQLSSTEVGDIASGEGVQAPLAEAVGWQESGDNNDEVSPTGAVGVMQIEPATWSYINDVLTPGAPLDPSAASDNVRAGAIYLHSLLAATGSPELAAASYYQGLASVERYGMFPSTEQYVNDVMSLADHMG